VKKTITFKYQKESLGFLSKVIKRPVAEIYLKAQSGDWIKINPYIDSGADTTLIPFSTGSLLGLTYKEDEVIKIGGLAGSAKAVRKKLKAKMGDVEFNLNLTWSLSENVPALLGRKDVFDKFNVTFMQSKEQIVFEEV
jgi:hypothetical protein